MANGAGKAAIVKRLIDEKETPDLPATVLKRHPRFYIYLDAEAAQLLR